jgi:hypothetical protein
MTGPTGQIMTGVLAAMQKDPELAETMRTSMVEDKQQVAQQMVDRAVARGELPAGADPEVFSEIAPALLFMQIFVHAEPVDEAFLVHVTDDFLIPLMTRC